jgi:hypothetical protein
LNHLPNLITHQIGELVDCVLLGSRLLDDLRYCLLLGSRSPLDYCIPVSVLLGELRHCLLLVDALLSELVDCSLLGSRSPLDYCILVSGLLGQLRYCLLLGRGVLGELRDCRVPLFIFRGESVVHHAERGLELVHLNSEPGNVGLECVQFFIILLFDSVFDSGTRPTRGTGDIWYLYDIDCPSLRPARGVND